MKSHLLQRAAGLAVIGTVLSGGQVIAANITIQTPVDLDNLLYLDESQIFAQPGANLMTGTFFGQNIQIKNGDTVNLSFLFTDGKKLKIADDGPDDTFEQISPWLMRLGVDYDFFEIANAEVRLLEPIVTGNAETQKFISQQIDGVAHVGPTAYNWLGPDSSVTFSGIQAKFDVVSIPTGEGTYIPWLNIYAEGFEIVSQSVPDAGQSRFLLLGAMGGLGLLKRRLQHIS